MLKFSKTFFFLFILVSSTLFGVNTNVNSLSENATVSLITCGPGPELYLSFGHSTLRIQDPDQNIDWIVNWGTFDFNTPYFYPKFVRGRLDYMITIVEYHYFFKKYVLFDQSIYEQVLNLNQEQQNRVLEYVLTNYQIENRFYKYDFFKDNCATRIGDLFLDEFEGEVQFQNPYEVSSTTYQKLLQPYLETQAWTGLGMNIVLGSEANHRITNAQKMFLPDHMRDEFALAKVLVDGEWEPFVKKEFSTYVSQGRFFKDKVNFLMGPSFWGWALFFLGFFLYHLECRRGEDYKDLNVLALFIGGFLTIFLFGMWFFTDHSAVNTNSNVLWTIPWGLIIVFIGKKLNLDDLKPHLWPLFFPSLFLIKPLISSAYINSALIPFILFFALRNMSYVQFYGKKSVINHIRFRTKS